MERNETTSVAPSRPRTRLPTGFSTIRDLITFIIGCGIIGNEVFLSPAVEPTAIGVGVAMAGLPLVFGADERKKGGGGADDSAA